MIPLKIINQHRSDSLKKKLLELSLTKYSSLLEFEHLPTPSRILSHFNIRLNCMLSLGSGNLLRG